MEEINWVKERAKCSLEKVFQDLKVQVEQDVNCIRELCPEDSYTFSSNKARFSVTYDKENLFIDFALGENFILVSNNRESLFQATLTINDDGFCRVNIKGEKIEEKELELWQVRRRALEALFFCGLTRQQGMGKFQPLAK
jgi:hypothetical protein